MKQLLIAAVAGCISLSVIGQDTLPSSRLSWLIFADTYYSYDFNRPANHEKPDFLYNHKRHNEFSVNLALIQVSYQDDKVRGNIGLQAGNYPEYNYAAEADILKSIYQANVGVRLSSKKNIWLDAGILPAHIGYESAISKDNWTLTRSLMSENSPFFETGVKLSYTTPDERWLLSALVLNGWQRIAREVGNNTPAFGTQLTFTPNEKTTLNWSTFVGNEYPDELRKWRYFNNFFAVFEPSEKVGITVAFDIGTEQAAKGSSHMNSWYTANVVLRYILDKNWAIAARGEYYSDATGVLIPTGTGDGFKTFGASFNLDKKVGDHFRWRTEVRTLNSKDAIFKRNNLPVNDDTFVTTSFAIEF